MKINLNIEYVRMPDDVETPATLSRRIIDQAALSRWRNGMPRQESRIWGKILEQLYQAEDEIELTEDQFELLRETVDQAVLLPHWSSWKWTLIDHLNRLKDK